ncbi:MAG: ABC transporter ATP-binding protein [Promethearchaeota archaeon]
MADKIIETFNLSKIYKMRGKKEIVALDKVNLFINKGETFGLLGPNGAGKTTFASILTTLLSPTSGYAIVSGQNIVKNPKHAKLNIALMLDKSMLYNRLTGYDNLKFCCKFFNITNYKQKIEHMASQFGLKDWLNQFVEKYSSGMQMKLALLRTLLLEREILLLDEPTLGLDVNSKDYITNKLKKINKTIILTSHDMGVVEKLCDRIGIINQGKIIKVGTKNEISQLYNSEIKIKIDLNKHKNDLKSELKKQHFVLSIDDIPEGFDVYIKERNYYNELLKILSNYPILKISEKELPLGELFLKLIYTK